MSNSSSMLRSALETNSASGMRPLVILAASDAALRHSIEYHLRPICDLITSEDGADAFDRLWDMHDVSRVACVIADQRMPNMSGIELLARALVLAPAAMRVIIADYDDVECVVEAIERIQIYRYILKPIEPNDFRLTIKSAIDAFEMRGHLDAYRRELDTRVQERTRKLVEKNEALDKVLMLLQSHRAHGTDCKVIPNAWTSRQCAIYDEHGALCYAEAGFAGLLALEWADAGVETMPAQLLQIANGRKASFVGQTLILSVRQVCELWLVRARKKLPIDLLTEREVMVVDAMADGFSHKEIARKFGLSPSTVRSHIQRIHEKLDAKTNAEIIAKCLI